LRSFWEKHYEFVKKGIIHAGKFEGYFRIFRKWILPLTHSRNDIEELREKKSAEERALFYRDRWDTAGWKLLFRLFFSRTVMGRLGRDPEFFRYVEGDVAGRLLKRVESALTALPTHDNPYLEYILAGNFHRALPHYLRPENFDTIRRGLDRLVLFKGDVVDALDANRGLKFDGFNLSDIFEYMNHSEYLCELCRLIKASKRGGRLVYWNMLSDRMPPAEYLDRIEPLEELARELFMRDKAFFYKAFRIEVIR
jgi:S-adenosylmethionine-diacylglycerol 3-amino-3-carboxypropyl transferase